MFRRAAAVAVAVSVVIGLSGCAGLLGGVYRPAAGSQVVDDQGGSEGSDGPDESETTPEPESTDSEIDYAAIDQEVADAISIVDSFWSEHFDDYYVGASYQPPSDFIPYLANDLPTCGGEPVEPDNAFYCISDNTILWDQDLMDYLYVNGGDAVIYLVIAHEWGHEIQAQIADDALWNAQELQADCFAAAALYGAADDGDFEFEEGDTAEITNALTFLADETAWTDTESHGDPLDRIDAFNDGRVSGVEGCFPVE